MSGLAFLAAGIIQSATIASDERGARLDLLSKAASASSYAADRFRCEGVPVMAAGYRAAQALGRDFNARLSRAARRLEKLYGKVVVQERTDQIAIDFRINPARCAQVRGIIHEARASLSNLELSLGTF